MPKATMPMGAGKKPMKITRKFKIGGRKSNISALTLTTPALVEKLETVQPRYAQKILQVLDARGFDLKAHKQAIVDAAATALAIANAEIAAAEAAEAAELAAIEAADAAQAADTAILDATDVSE